MTTGDGEAAERPSGVQSIDRAVAILTAFSRARPVVGISELAKHTGLSRGTTHRLVSALASHGMLAQVPGSSAYSLGPRLLGLSEAARDQLSLDVQARPVMTWLRDQTDETVGLHILDAAPSRRTIAQVESLQALRRTYTDLGAAKPPHQGAPGKVLLAHAPADVIDAVLARLPGADVRLADELARVRADGYAISLEERVRGVVAVAVPVRDHTGSVSAALSVSIPAVRAGRDELVALTPTVRKAAATLSARLGHAD
ncbi:IclR family transcriptional regulator [Amycolatopsis endophytica]|uniref:Glycerol operon regulatory protein n=1 Tax=Amycolatopsis endophytica TaxID=860233 RepID=A0A853B5X2_9PSEU|nr:IclR family transcriptional regulator [Amycolatopsis endophytica]NYI90469.1 IclR family acetate operon transcriptional repressor [Amycolatopsis endophytica]